MRSLLFVPGDSPEKMEKALRSGADALILDLEDSVAEPNKEEARRIVLAFLQGQRAVSPRPLLYVRINPLSGMLADGDLDVVMTGAPTGIMLPKAGGGGDVAVLAARLAVREALHGLPDGSTRIVPIVTETAASLFKLGTYAGASERLAGLAWGAEDLSVETGARAVRIDGRWTEPVRLVRNLALFAAAAAGVPPIDTVYTHFRDMEGLARECVAAVRDGFSGKLAIHPDQVEVINEAFQPSAESILLAQRIVAAFAETDGAGVASIEGVMFDRPHLRAAEELLQQASRTEPQQIIREETTGS